MFFDRLLRICRRKKSKDFVVHFSLLPDDPDDEDEPVSELPLAFSVEETVVVDVLLSASTCLLALLADVL